MDVINMALNMMGTNLNEYFEKYLSPILKFKDIEERNKVFSEVNSPF